MNDTQWQPTFKDPQQAFEQAITAGVLSASPKASNFAGDYMYMGTDKGRDYFKHIVSRRTIKA